MELLLYPDNRRHSNLWLRYNKAFTTAKELFIATAYLTDWAPSRSLNKKCRRFLFVVGTDFGLTRKAACSSVIQWLPKKFSPDFLAVPALPDGGFHPKTVVWKDFNNHFYAIIGSSNMTRAGFSHNVEANVLLQLKEKDYLRIVEWIEAIAQDSQIITDQWIERYQEKRMPQKSRANNQAPKRVIQFHIPSGSVALRNIQDRRKQQNAFKEIAGPLKSAIKSCALGKMNNRVFWRQFWKLWSKHPSRFQGSGLQFTAKSANWREACFSMWTILLQSRKVSKLGLDRIVSDELDFLASKNNPVRQAWFTEILCHYFPKQYPLLNNPVKKWLARNKWRSISGVGEGVQYIDLARKLREAIRQSPNGPKNLAELDGLIWQ